MVGKRPVRQLEDLRQALLGAVGLPLLEEHAAARQQRSRPARCARVTGRADRGSLHAVGEDSKSLYEQQTHVQQCCEHTLAHGLTAAAHPARC